MKQETSYWFHCAAVLVASLGSEHSLACQLTLSLLIMSAILRANLETMWTKAFLSLASLQIAMTLFHIAIAQHWF